MDVFFQAVYLLGAASVCAATGYLHAKTTLGYNRRDIVFQTTIVAVLWPLLLFAWTFIGLGETIAEEKINQQVAQATKININV